MLLPWIHRRSEAESFGHFHQVGERVGFHLLHHLAPVRLHRDLANPELETDLLIQQAGDYQRHDLLFARGERCITVAQGMYLRLVTKCGAASLNGMPDRPQQHLVVERLRQELGGPRLHSPHRHRDVAVARDKDDRHVSSVGDELLQIETIKVRKRNVKYQAAWGKDSWTGEEFLCGGERLGLPAREADQQFQRFAYRNVIVNNENDWLILRLR